jgi:hypothetical protein
MTHNIIPGRSFILAAGLFLIILYGCNAKRLPLTQKLLDSGISFEQIPSGLIEFNTYAASPQSKAFAAAIYPDGTVHSWAKA